MEVQIYTKTDCPFCVQAKQWFKEFNIDVIDVLINSNADINISNYLNKISLYFDLT